MGDTALRLKALARRSIPPRALALAQKAAAFPTLGKAQRAFDAAGVEPAWLPADELPRLQACYPPPPDYPYDRTALAARGSRRATELLRVLPDGGAGLIHFLELGCWDGMVSGALAGQQKAATATDRRDEGFDRRAADAGARLMAMDACALDLPDGSFDVVFSFDAFEHVPAPAAALAEAARVVRPGGFVFLEFGPLYLSPMGLHAYRSVNVPYCQLLFSRQVLESFVADEGLRPIDFEQVNGWSVERYRALWDSMADRLSPIRCTEALTMRHLGLVARHPSCFKSKTSCFDDLVVSTITVLFRRRG
jgi:SAM-dependent methyltransferase